LLGGRVGVRAGAAFELTDYRSDPPVDDVLKLAQAVMAPVVGIVGAVTGFYFSSTSGGSSGRRGDGGP
jgi:hypothetical protein